ncbi:MAG: hypothetical protein ACJ74U_18980 [Jatrophihabitantaceae bacterium]
MTMLPRLPLLSEALKVPAVWVGVGELADDELLDVTGSGTEPLCGWLSLAGTAAVVPPPVLLQPAKIAAMVSQPTTNQRRRR